VKALKYTISVYHINESTSVNAQDKRRLLRSRTSEQYFVSVSRVYFVSINDILMWMYDSSVGIAIGYGLGGWSSIPGRGKGFFSTSQRSDRVWGPPSLLYNAYQGLFPWG
jgi:hypothetical protein